jgi:hypothetical protein
LLVRPMVDSHKTLAEMLGEICRVIGVLVLVFLPLDRIVNHEFTVEWLWIALGISFFALAAGIALELSRGRAND